MIPVILFSLWKRYWVATEGVITKTEIKYSNDRRRNLLTDYCIQYSFLVGKNRYFGADTIRVEVPYYEEKDKMEQLRNDYAVGTAIEIFHSSQVAEINSARREVAGLYELIFSGTVMIFGAIVFYYWEYAQVLSERQH